MLEAPFWWHMLPGKSTWQSIDLVTFLRACDAWAGLFTHPLVAVCSLAGLIPLMRERACWQYLEPRDGVLGTSSWLGALLPVMIAQLVLTMGPILRVVLGYPFDLELKDAAREHMAMVADKSGAAVPGGGWRVKVQPRLSMGLYRKKWAWRRLGDMLEVALVRGRGEGDAGGQTILVTVGVFGVVIMIGVQCDFAL